MTLTIKKKIVEMSDTFMVVDIETDGIGTFRPPIQRPIEVAWVVCDAVGHVLKRARRLVAGVERIHPKAAEVHGYTVQDINAAEGSVSMDDVLTELEQDCCHHGIGRIVGHNIDFDIGCLCHQDRVRLKGKEGETLIPTLRTTPTFCTMRHGTDLCKLEWPHKRHGQSFNTFKWPKLKELALFAGVQVDDTKLHGAEYDVEITRQCYKTLFIAGRS